MKIALLLCLVTCSAWSPSKQTAGIRMLPGMYSSKTPFADEETSLDSLDTTNANCALWGIPPVLSTASFFLYGETSLVFHNTIVFASGRTWIAGEAGVSDFKPLLNGPVTLSVSILLGTLVSMTIQTLYDRQTNIYKALISQVEEVRELSLLLESYPEPHKTRGKTLVDSYLNDGMQNLYKGKLSTTAVRSQAQILGVFKLMLNELSNQPEGCPAFIDEAYGCVNRLKDVRAELVSTIQTTFSVAHYSTMAILASIILFVFLLETDVDEAQGQVVNFPLSICWALLVGTYSMLVVVIADLLQPLSSIQNVLKATNQSPTTIQAYALLKTRDPKS